MRSKIVRVHICAHTHTHTLTNYLPSSVLTSSNTLILKIFSCLENVCFKNTLQPHSGVFVKHFWGFQGTKMSHKKRVTHTEVLLLTKGKTCVWAWVCVFISEGAEGKAWDTQEHDWQTDTVAHRLCLMEGVLSPFPTALLLTGAEFSSEGENEKIKSQTD